MKKIRLVFSGDPDDAMAWWGALHGIVSLPGIGFEASYDSIAAINQLCVKGKCDIGAVSAAAYPIFADEYAILSSGASVARTHGPALMAMPGIAEDALRKGPVAIAGKDTTGGLAFQILFPDTPVVETYWRHIPNAILDGQVAAGICIHETLMGTRGLQKKDCIARMWREQTGLPLPVGLVVAKRSLGSTLLQDLAGLLSESVIASRMNRGSALRYAKEFSIGLGDAELISYIDGFTNDDTVAMGADVLAGLELLYKRGFEAGLIPRIPLIEPILPAIHPESSHAA